MALLDPVDHAPIVRRDEEHQPTTHPRLCLAGGFAFIVVVALSVHFAFNALF